VDKVTKDYLRSHGTLFKKRIEEWHSPILQRHSMPYGFTACSRESNHFRSPPHQQAETLVAEETLALGIALEPAGS
jgi:hypothetical protein